MKKFLVKFWKKNRDSAEYEVIGSVFVFDAGLIPLSSKAFMSAPDGLCRGADRLTWERV